MLEHFLLSIINGSARRGQGNLHMRANNMLLDLSIYLQRRIVHIDMWVDMKPSSHKTFCNIFHYVYFMTLKLQVTKKNELNKKRRNFITVTVMVANRFLITYKSQKWWAPTNLAEVVEMFWKSSDDVWHDGAVSPAVLPGCHQGNRSFSGQWRAAFGWLQFP